MPHRSLHDSPHRRGKHGVDASAVPFTGSVHLGQQHTIRLLDATRTRSTHTVPQHREDVERLRLQRDKTFRSQHIYQSQHRRRRLQVRTPAYAIHRYRYNHLLTSMLNSPPERHKTHYDARNAQAGDTDGIGHCDEQDARSRQYRRASGERPTTDRTDKPRSRSITPQPADPRCVVLISSPLLSALGL
jgi:hypothetical protein